MAGACSCVAVAVAFTTLVAKVVANLVAKHLVV